MNRVSPTSGVFLWKRVAALWTSFREVATVKYIYHFANGEQSEIEISMEEYRELIEADRREYNNDQANTRRHVSLDMIQEMEGMQFAKPTAFPWDVDALSLRLAIEALPMNQQCLIRAVYFKGVPVKEIAASEGVSGVAITRRLRRAEKNLRKLLIDRSFGPLP